MSEEIGVPSAFFGLVDLVSKAVGGEALLASDDFFAGKENLIQPTRAVWDVNAYTDHGKWMDGWESRRKRVPGHDWCILRLGVPGRLRGVDIDTSFFTGNHPPFASIDACVAPSDATPEWLRDQADWREVLPQMPLKRGSSNLHAIADGTVYTHVRLNIFPDGGVARLRLYGEPVPVVGSELIDLAALANGARTVGCTDSFFSPMQNLILPGKSTYMGGGWETRRSRPPGVDWILVELAKPGLLETIELQTTFFDGNFPDTAQVDGLYWPGAPPASLVDHPDFTPITAMTKMKAHTDHTLPVTKKGPWTHLRLRIIPDGGIARMRAWGHASTAVPEDAALAKLNAMSDDDLGKALANACGSPRWVKTMVAARPYTSRTHLHGLAKNTWWKLGDGEWLAAFAHHPRIGADITKLREKYGSTAFLEQSVGEQAGVSAASEGVLQELAAGNQAYEARYGWLFIVCATGLSADEMLQRLTDRLDNPPANELRIAGGEQVKITAIRLNNLLGA